MMASFVRFVTPVRSGLLKYQNPGIKLSNISYGLREFHNQSPANSIFNRFKKPEVPTIQHTEDLNTELQTDVSTTDTANATDANIDPKDITTKNDKLLQRFVNPTPRSGIQYFSPLKGALYKANVAKNGYFVNNSEVEYNGSRYKFYLTKKEIEAIEPSMYLKSYRIKGSTKKAMVATRHLRGLDLDNAITQCHFGQRRITREVGEMLTRGKEDAKKLGMDPKDLYIAQIWTGSDGSIQKKPDFKARGRVGIITMREVHVRVILKSIVTKKRLEYENKARLAKRKVKVHLPSTPIRYKAPGYYRW